MINYIQIIHYLSYKRNLLNRLTYHMSKQTRALELLDALIAKIETDITIAQTQDKKVEIAEVKVQVVQEAQKEQVKEAEKVEKGEKKENKKKKGENGKQNKKPQPQKAKLPPGADEDILAFAECDLRISQIVECWKHPQSTYLYCQRILVGKELREIASGLQEYIPIEQMKGKVIVFANLKPRSLGGFNSNGMVICSSNQLQTQFDLLSPEGPLGERLYLEGFEELFQGGEILPIIKKKTLQKCKEHFNTDAQGHVTWKNIKLRTKAGYVRSKILSGRVD